MNKRIILVGFIIFSFVFNTFSQDTNFIYFDKKWQETKESKAKYIRKEITLPNSYKIEMFYSNGTPIYKGEYSSLEPEIENGTTLHYDENGKLIERGYFTYGYPDSLWYVLNPVSGLFDTLNYIGIKELIKSLDDPSSFPETYVIVEDMPSFPGKHSNSPSVNFKDFRAFIKSETYYPMMARKRKIQGSVVVMFTVGPDGNIYDIMIPKPKSKYFDYEAVRVIRNSPKWNPGKQKGEPLPIRVNTSVWFYL
ncbi:MAG: energy transducer TonB [Bacteroidales bacterium]|nr:energy transducer TonB [Bacteroidales bacterium]